MAPGDQVRVSDKYPEEWLVGKVGTYVGFDLYHEATIEGESYLFKREEIEVVR